MNQITIEIQAYGFRGEDDQGLEINQEKKVDKEVGNDWLTEKDCQIILQEMTQAVNDIKLLFPNEDKPMNNKLDSIKFDINYKRENGDINEFDEESFFNTAVVYDSLSDAILEYTIVTDNGDEGSRVWIPENDNYESYPAGTFAMLALVQRDKKWIPNYIDFLRTNDLDHEMMQRWHINNIIEKYGWCDETAKLAIARNVSCCGQGGKEQFSIFIESGLKNYVAENRKMFIQNIMDEFESWKELEFRLKDSSEKYYSLYIVSYVKHFESLLSENEIQDIETFLMQKWKDYNES